MFLLNPGNLWAFIRVHYGVQMNSIKYNYIINVVVSLVFAIYLYIDGNNLNIDFSNISFIIPIILVFIIPLLISVFVYAFKFYKKGLFHKHLVKRLTEKDEDLAFGKGEYSRGANLFISYFSIYTIFLLGVINYIFGLLFSIEVNFMSIIATNFIIIATALFTMYLIYFLLKSFLINIYNWFTPME